MSVKAANFAKTGNIEIVIEGQRSLIGQYVESEVRLNWVKLFGLPKKHLCRAIKRVCKCINTVVASGRSQPKIVLFNFDTGKPILCAGAEKPGVGVDYTGSVVFLGGDWLYVAGLIEDHPGGERWAVNMMHAPYKNYEMPASAFVPYLQPITLDSLSAFCQT